MRKLKPKMRRLLPDLSIVVVLFLLPLTFFWQQTLGGRTLLPAENIYQYEPFATYREAAGAPDVPHNTLLSDLVLENYPWKLFIRESIAQGEIPLWNPQQFAGIPFFAAGQPSTLYPFSVLYYVLPLPAAYGWFTVVQLWLAGAFMYAFLRGLRAGRGGALVAGVVYQLSAFFVISAVFPMIIAAAVWLPLLLLMIELVIREQPALRGRPAVIPWLALGALALGFNILAGHVEITYYTLIIMAYYAAARLAVEFLRKRGRGRRAVPLRAMVRKAASLVGMVALGMGLGAVQFLPLFEAAGNNFRDGAASFEQVRGWAHPARDVLQFALPNFYGSPAHHEYFDVFTRQTVPAQVNAAGDPINTIDWGIKNYVEGALYLGILPLALAGYALLDGWFLRRKPRTSRGGEPTTRSFIVIFAFLGLASLSFMFGMVTYAALFFTLPGFDQLHTPFRWVFGLTLSVAVLAGFGMDALATRGAGQRVEGGSRTAPTRLARRMGYGLMAAGVVVLAGLVLSRAFYPRAEPLVERLFRSMARAPEAFADARMFYSYEFRNVLLFGLFTFAAGVVFWLAARARKLGGRHALPLKIANVPAWQALAVGLTALDLMAASWGFNPASDPALLDFTPPAVAWLQAQEGEWRFTTLDDPAQRPLMPANLGWPFGLDDIRGYESIIPKQYVAFMERLAPQVQLDFNRVAPLYTDYGARDFDVTEALESPLLRLLNVRYVMTHTTTAIASPRWELAYEDEAVRIWELLPAFRLPRAYSVASDDLDVERAEVPTVYVGAEITRDTGRELFVDARPQGPSWLVVSQTHVPGWRAFIRPAGAGEGEETPAAVRRVLGNFQGVFLPESGEWAVRLVYSPASFQVGLFASFISGALIVFIVGVWLWRLSVVARDETSGISLIARNSVAPIVLNLFNRFIDFAFALVMLRILGPAEAGIYYYAIIIFGWFDIFTNFGLNLFLTREVARDRSRAARYFFNTSALRVLLALAGVPLLIGFLGARQTAISPPLATSALLAVGLLYVGLLPNSLSTGMSALFYAFEKAEYPAAVTTLATISKATLGLAALLLGYGVVGLAGVSIITNAVTLAVLLYGGRALLCGGDTGAAALLYRIDRKLLRGMVTESWPLMLNHFLAQIFFQIDVVIIEAIHGARMVGQYSVAYKWVLALNIIPAFFTQAMLPVMSRQGRDDRAALKRNYQLSIKLLVSLALPVAALFTFLARPLTYLLGGAEFLPEGAIALQLMIWSIPIGWINSLTQYLLIALDLQRRITRAFTLGVGFNIVANLIFVPRYGFQAAAVTTILSEIVLLIPFALLLQGSLGKIDWFGILWRPAVATAGMVVVLAVGWPVQPLGALAVSGVVYPGVLLALRPLDEDEKARLLPLLPARLRGMKVPVPGQ